MGNTRYSDEQIVRILRETDKDTVVEVATRECLANDVAGSIRAARVIEVLSRLVNPHGAPKYLRSDNGPEFVSTQLLQWAANEKLETVQIERGKPWKTVPMKVSMAKSGMNACPWNGFATA